MPIPKPKQNEKQKEFVMRCVADLSNEYDQDQALAICYNEYKNKNK